MKALTLAQPYATLVAEGLKTYETRSWRTHYRGPLAIHAAKGYSGLGGRLAFERACLDLPRLVRELINATYSVGPAKTWMLPLGSLVAVTWIEEVEPAMCVRSRYENTPAEIELRLGSFEHGRFAWRLRKPVRIDTPIEMGGHRGLWSVDDDLIPEHYRKAIRHAV